MPLSRRRLVAAGAAGLFSVAYGPILRRPGSIVGALVTDTQVITVTAMITQPIGQYLEAPFTVPAGVNRIDLKRTSQPAGSKIGLGLFDQRGAGYQSPGFRGIFGEEAKDDPGIVKNGVRGACFVSAHAASDAFVPGTIEPGTWTVLIPVFTAQQPGPVVVTVTLSMGPQQAPFVPGPVPDVVRDEPGWYRGDLHCHTGASSDAWNSNSALSPRMWADELRSSGMHFASMTDHNVVSQNNDLLNDSGGDVLLIAGEEMTNWFHGHATVTGIQPGDWLDWRQTPGGAPLPTGRDGATVARFLALARDMGAYVAAAHPYGAQLSWQFLPEGAADPASQTDGLEIWTGNWFLDDEQTMRHWDELLLAGQRIVANGGSDLHGVRAVGGFPNREPTTVVWATSLARDALIDGIRAGRSYITRHADGVELYLQATGPDGQREMMGGTVFGAPSDVIHVESVARGAGGLDFHWVVDGVRRPAMAIGSDDETFALDLPVGTGAYVRTEVRGPSELVFDPTNPTTVIGTHLGMEAFTNPVFLALGTPPDTPPPTVPELPHPAAGVALAAGLGLGAVAMRQRRRSIPSPVLPTSEGPRWMTLTELRSRAVVAEGLDGVVRLVGEVVDVAPETFRLARSVRGCCPGEDPEVSVLVRGGVVADGDWVQVDARWVRGTVAGDGSDVEVEAVTVGPVAPPDDRREDGPAS